MNVILCGLHVIRHDSFNTRNMIVKFINQRVQQILTISI